MTTMTPTVTLLEAAVEAAEARHHEQVELARSWRSLSTKALGAGRCAGVLGRGAGQARGGWAALWRLRAAHEWLLLELGTPVPRGGEPAVDAAARVVVVVRARAIEGVPEEVGQHELAALLHRVSK